MAKGKTTHRRMGMIHLQNLPHLHNDRDATRFHRCISLGSSFVAASGDARPTLVECSDRVCNQFSSPASLPALAFDLLPRTIARVAARWPRTVRSPTDAPGELSAGSFVVTPGGNSKEQL